MYTVAFLVNNNNKPFCVVKKYKRLIWAKKCLINLKANRCNKNTAIIVCNVTDENKTVFFE